MKVGLKESCFLVSFAVLVGCGDKESNTFTLVGELPPNFSYTASTWYVPDPETKCEVTNWRRTMPSFNKRWRKEYNPVAVVEIRKVIKGCQMILDHIKITINATYGDSIFQQGGERANIGVYVSLPERHRRTTVSETEDIFYGECEWLFRTATPERHVWKILDCKKDSERGEKGVGKPFAAYTLDQLPGKIIRMNIRLAVEERPYFKDTWVRFSDGWRRCMGKGKQDVRGYCRGNYADFSDFIMPDGRVCNVYPSCSE
ncbi:hypothetical protein KSS93_19955 [Pseudomonas xanthosomatis]|uniref:hypothetical protein n=1 Tax=Pseudomonas xanthosomatis TaxID=2842356 RepID=UPI001C3C942B|nr:hypothetical protein [Pseudomonas xanthosomatis]QXH45134.1 hypothetical protein KSS93_19955 [Pseudomonas xanthosomatis]